MLKTQGQRDQVGRATSAAPTRPCSSNAYGQAAVGAPLPDRDQGLLHGARSPERPELALGVDMLAPEGYGEIIGGGERIVQPRPAAEAHRASTSCPQDAVRVVPRPAQVTAASPTPASAWASSAWSPGSAASSTCARPSRSRACCTGCTPRLGVRRAVGRSALTHSARSSRRAASLSLRHSSLGPDRVERGRTATPTPRPARGARGTARRSAGRPRG